MKKKLSIPNEPIAVQDTLADKIFNVINLVLLGLITLTVLYPLYFVVIASFTDPNIVNSGTLLL